MRNNEGVVFEIGEAAGSRERRNVIGVAISRVGDLSISGTADFIEFPDGGWAMNSPLNRMREAVRFT